jgi:ribonuclease HI
MCRSIYGKSNFILRTADVGTAFLNAPIKTPYYVFPPTDIGLPEGKCWKLKRALYGLRGAPRAWYEHVCSYLASLGFSRLLTDPSVFVRGKGEKQVMILLYVDDMLFSGGSREIQKIIDALSTEFILKVSDELCKENDTVKMLGRLITRLKVGYSICGDFGVLRPSIDELGLEKSKPTSTPAIREVINEKAIALTPSEHRAFRRHVGRLNYMAGDRPDLKYAIKRLSQSLASPTTQDFIALKRVIRYVIGRPSVNIVCDLTSAPTEITVHVDSDWAGCPTSRRSTSGITIGLNGHRLIHFVSKTQSVVALSSCEAELNALVLALSESLCIRTLLKELDYSCEIRIYCDSNAAIQHVSKLGLGRLKHVSMKTLYVQDLLSRKVFSLFKIEGTKNIADILTKGVDTATLERLLSSKLWKITTSPSVGGKYDAECPDLDLTVSYLRMCLLKSQPSNYQPM